MGLSAQLPTTDMWVENSKVCSNGSSNRGHAKKGVLQKILDNCEHNGTQHCLGFSFTISPALCKEIVIVFF